MDANDTVSGTDVSDVMNVGKTWSESDMDSEMDKKLLDWFWSLSKKKQKELNKLTKERSKIIND